jgi:hypothetical protein
LITLQVRRIVATRLRDQAGVVFVDAEAWLATRRERNLPATADLARIRVGRDELGGRVGIAAAGLRSERTDQRQRGFEILFLDMQAMTQACTVLLCKRFQMIADEDACELQAWRFRSEYIELHRQAFPQVAAGDTDGIEMLHPVPDRFDFLQPDRVQRCERVADHLVGFTEITVVIDGFDDRRADRAIARRHRREIQLPQQVIAQILDLGVLRLHSVLVQGGAAVFGAIEIERLFVGGVGMVFAFRIAGRGLDVVGGVGFFAVAVFHVEQRVGFERGVEFQLEFQPRQLQKPDGLLQLWREGQRLAQPEL